MWRLAVRTVTAHRARLAMTLAAVGVGTGFLAGTLAFSAAAERAERSIPQRGDVAVRVRPADAQGHLPWSTVDDLAGLSGVARADAVVSGPGALLGRDGKVVEDAGGVTNWADTARFTRTAGRAPAGRGEVAVSAAAARTAGVRVGDPVALLLDESRHQARVVGLYDYRPLGQEAAPALALQTTAAQRLLGLGGRVSAVDLVAAPGVAAGELVGRAQAAVPDARVVDGQAANAEARERRSDELRTLRDALLGFAGVALLVGTLVIANTFSMLVGQRTRELALLRAVGMSRRQVRRMVLAEAVTVGLVGGGGGGPAPVGVPPGPPRRADRPGHRAARRGHAAAGRHQAAHDRRAARGRAGCGRVWVCRADRPDRRAGRAGGRWRCGAADPRRRSAGPGAVPAAAVAAVCPGRPPRRDRAAGRRQRPAQPATDCGHRLRADDRPVGGHRLRHRRPEPEGRHRCRGAARRARPAGRPAGR